MKRAISFLLSAALALTLSACSAKLTTVRPAKISELRVERIADGMTVTLPSTGHDADLKDILIFQLEEPYHETGDCGAADKHLYHVRLYIGDKLDTEVIINEDNSVCRGGKRHIPSDKADSPVNIGDWNALFTESDTSTDADSPAKPVEPSAQSTPTAPAETPTSSSVGDNLEIVASQGEAKPLPPGAEILQSIPAVDALPWSYYISDVRYDGQDFVMVWRDTSKGDAQWICSVAQTGEDTALRHSIEYVGGSFEGSGDHFLYFTIEDGANFHRSLWCLDPETLYFNRVLDVPCSNMILLAYEPHEARGIGWIVYDHYLAAVDLAAGSTDEGLTIDLDEYIDDHLFYGIGAFGTHKFVSLSDIGNSGHGEFALQLDAITAEPETSAPELRTVYQFDILTHKFSQIER